MKKQDKPIFPIGAKGTRGYSTHFIPYSVMLDAADEFRKVERHTDYHAAVEIGQLFYHISWHASAVKRLLKQPGAKGMKGYLARVEGKDTIVLVATDAEGVDIKTFALDWGSPCPPHCKID